MKKNLTFLAVAAISCLVWTLSFCACGSSSSDSGGGGGGPPPPPPPVVPPPPSAGWTALTESSDTVKIYVSDSDGNDADDGLTEATAKRTIDEGKALLRDGFPDWLLLKAGDTFTNQSLGGWQLSGRSDTEPMVVSSYGSGARPRLLTGTDSGLNLIGTPVSHVYIVGLHFFPHTYTGTQGSTGLVLLSVAENLLFEDCHFEGYATNLLIQAFDGPPGSIQDIRIRRSVIVDAWAAGGGGSTGLFAYGINGLLIEECVFDHNGWKEGPGGGPATIFNHGTYVAVCSNVVVRGNYFLRASNMGNKYRADATGEFPGLWIEDNVYIEGAIGIGCGGNTAEPLRFSNVTIRENLLMYIGRTDPNGQDIGWYISVSDWDGGLIEENLLLYQTQVSNAYGIEFQGSSERNVQVRDNLSYGLWPMTLRILINGSMSGITVSGNEFQDSAQGSQLVEHAGSFGPVTYQGNTYSTNAAASTWFTVNGNNNSYAQWVSSSGESGSTNSAVAYPNPGRDEASYNGSLGGAATTAAFLAEIRLQSKANWRVDYTASALNDYVRAGYGR